MNATNQEILFAFGLTLFAGLATGIGGALAFFTKQMNEKFLSAALGLSAGVMIYVSTIEIFPKARASLSMVYGPDQGYWITTLAFFGGIALIALIDKLVPEVDNPHNLRDVSEMDCPQHKAVCMEAKKQKTLLRTGIFTAVAIAIHNFPEGLATFTSALHDPALGASIAVAIAIHNIPEGISVAVPVYYATGSRRKAFAFSFLSGLAEPLGAIVGYFILRSFFHEAMMGLTFAGVAGIMVFISLDELLPTAQKYGEHHIAIYGLVSGMGIMALSLLLLS